MDRKSLWCSVALLSACAGVGRSGDSKKSDNSSDASSSAGRRADANGGTLDAGGSDAATGVRRGGAEAGGSPANAGSGNKSAAETPTKTNKPSARADAGKSDASGAAAAPGDIPCDVATVLTAHCVRCHGNTLKEGAPIKLIDAASFHRDLGGYTVSMSVLNRISDDARPMRPPPNARLDADETATLKKWIDGGAQKADPGCAVDTSEPSEQDAGSEVVDAGVEIADAGIDASSMLPPPATGGDWPAFGIDLSNSRNNANEQTLNTGNVGSLHEYWRFNGPSTTCAPAVVDGVVYLAGWDGKLYARRVDDGSEVWTTSLPHLIDSSPTVTDSQVFVSDDHGAVHALHRESGHEQWSTLIDDHPEAHLWSSPVYIPSAGLIVNGIASGEEQVLKTNFTFRGGVVGLDAASGEQRWRFDTASPDSGSGPGIGVWGTAAVDEGRKLLFIGTGNNYAGPPGRYSDSLLAIEYETGELRWSNQFTADDTYTIYAATGPDYDIGSSANLFSADGRDYVGIGVKSGNYYALDRDSGAIVWAAPLTAGAVLGGVISASAYADGLIFVVSNTFDASLSTAFALDARNGGIVWRNNLANLTYGGVAHANGVVYVGTTAGSLYAFDGESGDLLFEDQTPDSQPIAGSPTVAEGRVFVPWGYQWTLRQGSAGNGGMTVYGL